MAVRASFQFSSLRFPLKFCDEVVAEVSAGFLRVNLGFSGIVFNSHEWQIGANFQFSSMRFPLKFFSFQVVAGRIFGLPVLVQFVFRNLS